MFSAKAVDTPIPVAPKLSKVDAGTCVDAQRHRSAVGALLYVCHTRPDIAFAVHKVAQFMLQPCEAHWTAVKRIFRYLKGTLDFGLCIAPQHGPISFRAFTDADWENDPDNRRSISGYCLFLENHLVFWNSRKQRSVSRSTAEAEYKSLADATSEVVWTKSLPADMGVRFDHPPTIWCDNTSTVAMVE
ncbi:secreted RxLR effector protein 161-like [Hibiscus syriacus]|nr:secreted RxLR effector protein 161-like [Hibiscus syriacus]